MPVNESAVIKLSLGECMDSAQKDIKVFASTDELLYEGELGDRAVIYCRRCALVYEKHIFNNNALGIRLIECIPYDGYKLFKILGGYAPSRTRWYYLLDTSRVAARHRFINTFSWLKPYKVELITDEQEIYDILHDKNRMPM